MIVCGGILNPNHITWVGPVDESNPSKYFHVTTISGEAFS